MEIVVRKKDLKLPKEIRTSVLDLVFEPQRVSIELKVKDRTLDPVRRYTHRSLCPGTHLDIAIGDCFDLIRDSPEDSRLRSCRWAGHVIFKEVVKAWYRRNNFIIAVS